MSGYKVEICGVNTSKLPLLTTEEKEELFKRILAGDMQAREDFINGNLRLVLSGIQRFTGGNENIDDLFQIGCIGHVFVSSKSIKASESKRIHFFQRS